MSNPETIEIHGLRTIHKLCKFGADKNMEGCTFTEIVERMFVELEKAKAQAVPEGYVLMPKEPNDEIVASMKLTWWESDCAHIMKTSVAKSIYAGIVKASESGAEG